MNSQKKLLKIVSNMAKASIEKLDVVTPTLFSSLFYQYAKEHNLKLEDEKSLTRSILEDECFMLTNLQTQTSKNVSLLSQSTSKAIGAIQSSNETLLNEVLMETQALKREIEKLKKSVYLDTLTKTYNRKWLEDNYIKEDSHETLNGGVLALIDLNFFKIINDTYGHLLGDKVLTLLAREFLSLRYPVVRYGGDEFLIIFDESVTLKGAKELLNSTREKILKKKFKTKESTFTLSFSFGLKAFKADDSFVDILEAADKSMYEDKVEIKKRVTSI